LNKTKTWCECDNLLQGASDKWDQSTAAVDGEERIPAAWRACQTLISCRRSTGSNVEISSFARRSSRASYIAALESGRCTSYVDLCRSTLAVVELGELIDTH